jgi:uncharacterized protein (TIGR04255 family)
VPERSKDLPDFSHPPVVEVALGLQFEPLPRLDTPAIARFWFEDIRSRFPEWTSAPALPPTIEWFGVPGQPRLIFGWGPGQMAGRSIFQDQSKKELLQLQQDRFVRNWKKAGADDTYPRYEKIRASFIDELNALRRFIAEQKLGDLVPTQCEVTYVNHIPLQEARELGQVGFVVSAWSGQFSDNRLSAPETVEIATHHAIVVDGNAIGRLHIAISPGYLDSGPLLVLTLTARGRPAGPSDHQILDFLNLGREQIVRGFASITTPQMHTRWGRKT